MKSLPFPFSSIPFALVLVAPAFLVSDSRAGKAELSLAHTSVITNSEGDSRVLIDLGPLPSEVRGELVTSAFLTIPIPRVTPASDVVIRLERVTTPWVDRSPTWEAPWRTPGGDVEGTAPITEVLWKETARTSLSFDVTEMVRDVADGEAEDCGFLLTVPSHRGQGLSTAELAALGSLEGARLRISYSPIQHLGFDGSRSIAERAQRLRTKAVRVDRASRAP